MEVDVGPWDKNIIVKLPIMIGADFQTNAPIDFLYPIREYLINIISSNDFKFFIFSSFFLTI